MSQTFRIGELRSLIREQLLILKEQDEPDDLPASPMGENPGIYAGPEDERIRQSVAAEDLFWAGVTAGTIGIPAAEWFSATAAGESGGGKEIQPV